MTKNSAHKKVAIFDVDGTIFRSSLLIEFVEALIAAKVFPEESRYAYELHYKRWLNRTGSYENYIEGVIDAFMKHLKGVSYEDFDRVGKEVVEANKGKVYRYTRDLVKKLKRKGYWPFPNRRKASLTTFANDSVSTKSTGASTNLANRTGLPAKSST